MTRVLTYIEIDVPSFTSQSPEALQTFRFAIPVAYLPGDIDCIPSIDSVNFTPARISLGENLGQRASLSVTLRDHLHVFASEPYNQGTFWGKWRGRYGVKLRGRALRLIRGQIGQTIEQMETRYYVIEATDGPAPDGTYKIEAKDILKYADDDRAQAPLASNGSLDGTIEAADVKAILSPTGIGDTEYPLSGYLCLGGSEITGFTRVSDTLTLTRGQFGSQAAKHEAGDRVQIVLRYVGNDVADIIYDLLVNYAGVPADYISLTDWQAETAAYLGVIYAATITEPTAVRTLLSELIQQASLILWWDDRTRQVRLNVLREIATDTDLFDEDRIIEGSLRVQEQPTKRISQIWTFYGQRDPTKQVAGADNYRAGLLDVDLGRETEYGSAALTKITARWIETLTAASRLNSLQLSRFRDPPRAFAFDLALSETVTPAAGYQVSWWGSQDETGLRVNIPIQVTQVSIHPDRIHVEAEEMLASGVVVLQNVVFLTSVGAGQWTVPDTWNDANNSVEVIGGAGGGCRGHDEQGGRGGGGGAYSKETNINLTPGASVDFSVGDGGTGGKTTNPANGTAGGDTWFGAATYAASNVAAKGGQGGELVTGGGLGGQAAAGIGSTKFSGGDGGTGAQTGDRVGAGGGGAAAGPHGDGADGGNMSGLGSSANAGSGGGGADGGFPGDPCSGNTPGDGGDNRFSYGGGNSTSPGGDEGGGGRGGYGSDDPSGHGGDGEQIWTQTISPIISAGPGGGGGGGGGYYTSAVPGSDGGLYGGAGGGGYRSDAGDGTQGLIVITWTEAV